MITSRPLRYSLALVACTALLAACGETEDATDSANSSSDHAGHQHTGEQHSATPRLVVAYDGGVRVLDAGTLEQVADLPRAGFLRLNPAGDDRHVVVSTEAGFEILDAGSWTEKHGDHSHHRTGEPSFTGAVFPGDEPGHAVAHDGRLTLFFDGSGVATIVEQADLTDTAPPTAELRAPHAHHGVAVTRADGSVVMSRGTAQSRNGVAVLGADRAERAATTECPGVHGEASAADGVLLFGCENGVVVVRGDQIRKIAAPDAYGRIGNSRGSEASPVVLGDYKTAKDLPEGQIERPTRFSLIDTAAGTLRLVDLPTSYSFRSLARGPEGQAVILGTDGALYVYDAGTGSLLAKHPVIGAWREPIEWQQPMPSVTVQGGTAFVSDPAAALVHAVDLATGRVLAKQDIGVAAVEVVAVAG